MPLQLRIETRGRFGVRVLTGEVRWAKRTASGFVHGILLRDADGQGLGRWAETAGALAA